MLLPVEPLTWKDCEEPVARALAEDVGSGDVTTNSVIPPETLAEASMVAREPMVVAGLTLARVAFSTMSSELTFQEHHSDGFEASPGDVLLTIRGPARALLTAERVALNFVQRLSGIATSTRRFVEAVAGTGTIILDTRKTTPGLRNLEKYAVRCGGARNHRTGLFDMAMIKDNHLAALGNSVENKPAGFDPVALAVRAVRDRFPGVKVEVEADRLDQVRAAVRAGADRILLDNMDLQTLRQATAWIDGRVPSEASGGINLENVRAIAETGVNFISIGALTHSARSVDIGLDIRIDAAGAPASSTTGNPAPHSKAP